MIMRILGAALPQVMRSIAWLLLPISFISLIAWATAGSSTGNTGDPLRAALWIWLGAHQIPFSLSLSPSGLAGFLSYLPLGAIIFPIFVIRNGVKRTIEGLDGDSSLIAPARAVFVVIYTSFALVVALLSKTEGIRPVWYFAFIYVLPFSLICAATVGRKFPLAEGVLYGSRIFALLLGLSSITLGVLVFLNLSIIKDLTVVLQPGIFGGILLLVLNILYLPNAVVATLGYFSGVGFSVGLGTVVSPTNYSLDKIPAMPLLGVLPQGKSLVSLLGMVIIVFAGALLASWTLAFKIRVLTQSVLVFSLITLFVGYSGSGALITDAMSTVGVSPWKFTLAICLEVFIGILAVLYLPRLFKGK